jgi:DNA-directed RNA polymerase specialized sigma24 family protein
MAAEGFQALLERLRAGDQAAAAQIVSTYESALLRMIRVRMADRRLRRQHGASDIFQSVMGSFFVRVALGQYELRQPEDLVKLLAVMVRNKVAEKARRRDVIKEGEVLEDGRGLDAAAPDASPSRIVELRQLAAAARARLPPELLQIVALRDDGLEWNEIAARVGGSAEALRKRLARAASDVAESLGVDVVRR